MWRCRKEGEKDMKKEHRKKHRIRNLAITLLVFLLLFLGVLYLAVWAVYGKMNYEEATSHTGQPLQQEGVTHILLIGSDAREGVEGERSDAMILLSLSSRTNTIAMTSLLRDMYVEIPGYGGNRLNAAYAYGGPDLLMETISQNLGIEVNRYVLANFEAFSSLVDAAGGVELELTEEELAYVNAYLVEYNQITGRPEGTDYLDASTGGKVHLNGPQALAYSRIRYIGTDFGRTQRQRNVLSAVMKSLPKALLQQPGELAEGVFSNLTTNLTRSECFYLSLQAGRGLYYEIKQGSIPVPGSYQDSNIQGMAVLEVDFEKNRAWIKQELFEEGNAKDT